MIPKLKGRKIFDRDAGINNESKKHKLLLNLREMLAHEEFKKPDMMDLYGSLPATHLLYTVNIMSIAQVQALDPFQLKENLSIVDTLQTDNIVEQVTRHPN